MACKGPPLLGFSIFMGGIQGLHQSELDLNFNPFPTNLHNSTMKLRIAVARLTQVFGCYLLCLAVISQAAPLTVKPIPYKGTMPYVQSDNAKLAQRINNSLFLETLELPAPAKLQDGLTERQTPERMSSISDITFEVGRNDERIFALSVNAEGCGAYCEHYTNYFNFDAATGRRLTADDLFAPAGAAKLLKQLDALRLARVKAEIVKIRYEAKAEKGKHRPKENQEYFSDKIDMLEHCVATMTDPEMAKYWTLGTDKLKIGKDAITFERGRCSNHASRALDDIGEMTNAFPIKDITLHLSAYGNALLLGAGNALSGGGPFNQVLVGKVGQSTITMRLGARNSDDSVSSVYYYDKYRTPIALFGKVSNGVLTLTESDSKDKVLPVIRATISGESLKGQWIGNGRQIPFEVGP